MRNTRRRRLAAGEFDPRTGWKLKHPSAHPPGVYKSEPAVRGHHKALSAAALDLDGEETEPTAVSPTAARGGAGQVCCIPACSVKLGGKRSKQWSHSLYIYSLT